MLVGAVLVWKFLPPVDHSGPHETTTDAGATALTDSKTRRDPTVMAVVLICCIAGLIMVGHYTFYTYVAPFLIDGLGVDSASLAPLLFGYGIAGGVGLLLAGTVFGPRPQLGLVVSVAVCAVSVTVLAAFAANLSVAIGAFLLWGLAFGGLPPLLQTRLLHAASARIRDQSSAFYTTAFNSGIGGGALLGAVLLDAVGLGAVPFAYVGILVAALVLVVVSDVVIRRRLASA
jgi:predicted MFS family arabinose efflux permease